MVQKIIARQGLDADIPVMLTGEIGWDTDLKRFRVGDGTSTAPIVMTTKSLGPFSYPSIDYAEYPQINMIGTGTVDGVDISELNSANGFLVRRGDNTWGHRKFENTDGYLTVSNADGINGNVRLNAGTTLLAVATLANSALQQVDHDGSLTGLGTSINPLGVVQATTIQLGGAELATDAEVQAGTDALRIVTPASLSARSATTTRTGIAALATDIEVQTGTNTTNIVTPASLATLTATEARDGLVELATSAEVISAVDTTRAVTPAGLNAYIGNYLSYASSAEVIAGTVANKVVAPSTLATLTATESRDGLIELATAAEVIAAADTTRAITPAGLNAYIGNYLSYASTAEVQAGTVSNKVISPLTLSSRTATTTRTGLVELATDAEAAAGTDTTRYITPYQLKTYGGGGGAYVRKSAGYWTYHTTNNMVDGELFYINYVLSIGSGSSSVTLTVRFGTSGAGAISGTVLTSVSTSTGINGSAVILYSGGRFYYGKQFGLYTGSITGASTLYVHTTHTAGNTSGTTASIYTPI